MYWTMHLYEGLKGDLNPVVAVGKKIYSFGWPHLVKKPHERGPMHVHLLNTENMIWFQIWPTPVQEEYKLNPQLRLGHSAVVYEDKIYIWGGMFQEQFFDELLCFDTSTCTWSTPTVSGSIPQTRYAHFAFVIDHSMYLIGGYEKRKKYSPDVFALDLHTMKWEYIAAQSGPYMWEGISACAVGHRIYIFGGEIFRSHWNGGSFLDTITGKWHRIVICQSCPLTWKSPAFVHGNSIYVFGGSCNVLNWEGINLLKLSADTNKWEEVHMHGMSPVPRMYQACVVVNTRVFVFGAMCHLNEGGPMDLHIIDFRPNLRLLCIRTVLEYGLEISKLPKALQTEILNVCTFKQRGGSLSKLNPVSSGEVI